MSNCSGGTTPLLIWKSAARGAPVFLNSRPTTPLASRVLSPSQATRNSPEARPATEGTVWEQVVQELARTLAPIGAGPAAPAGGRAARRRVAAARIGGLSMGENLLGESLYCGIGASETGSRDRR